MTARKANCLSNKKKNAHTKNEKQYSKTYAIKYKNKKMASDIKSIKLRLL